MSSHKINFINICKENRDIIYEWILLLFLFACALIGECKVFSPHKQYIPGLESNDDSRVEVLSYPYFYPKISNFNLAVFSSAPWMITFAINVLLIKLRQKNDMFRWRYVLQYLHLLIRTMSFAVIIMSNVIKYYVGRPRPYFYAVYQANNNDENVSAVKEARLSFVSQHASLSFSLLFQMSLYLYQSYTITINKYLDSNEEEQKSFVAKIFDCKNPHSYYCQWIFYALRHCSLFSLIIVGCPTFWAMYISGTRLTDYHHFCSDILGGIMLGVLIAVVSFKHYNTQMMHLSTIIYADNARTRDMDISMNTSDAEFKNSTIEIEVNVKKETELQMEAIVEG